MVSGEIPERCIQELFAGLLSTHETLHAEQHGWLPALWRLTSPADIR